jgi:hypothetical protein
MSGLVFNSETVDDDFQASLKKILKDSKKLLSQNKVPADQAFRFGGTYPAGQGFTFANDAIRSPINPSGGWKTSDVVARRPIFNGEGDLNGYPGRRPSGGWIPANEITANDALDVANGDLSTSFRVIKKITEAAKKNPYKTSALGALLVALESYYSIAGRGVVYIKDLLINGVTGLPTNVAQSGPAILNKLKAVKDVFGTYQVSKTIYETAVAMGLSSGEIQDTLKIIDNMEGITDASIGILEGKDVQSNINKLIDGVAKISNKTEMVPELKQAAAEVLSGQIPNILVSDRYKSLVGLLTEIYNELNGSVSAGPSPKVLADEKRTAQLTYIVPKPSNRARIDGGYLSMGAMLDSMPSLGDNDIRSSVW